MADIFISYKREDLEKVRPLAEIFENKGWSVWWDPKLRGGKPFSQDIERALSEARCVIVVWSNKSIDSYWVAAEATKGLNRDILVAVSIESNVEPPVPFNVIHTNPLINWGGTSPSTQFDKIVEDLKSILGPPPVDVKEAERKAEKESRRKQEETRKLREDEQRKAEEERQRLEEEKQRLAEEKRKFEKEQKRIEAARTAEEERKQREAKAKRNVEVDKKRKEVKAEIKPDKPKPDATTTTEPKSLETHKTRNALKFGVVAGVIVLLMFGVWWYLWVYPEFPTRF